MQYIVMYLDGVISGVHCSRDGDGFDDGGRRTSLQAGKFKRRQLIN